MGWVLSMCPLMGEVSQVRGDPFSLLFPPRTHLVSSMWFVKNLSLTQQIILYGGELIIWWLHGCSILLELLEEFGCSGAAISSPLDPSFKLHLDLSTPLADPAIFRRLVGKLNYLTNTRPNICFSVLTLSQYMQKPHMLHLSTGMRVLRYLSTDPTQGNLLSANPSLDLLAFCDSNWAACKTSRRSVIGFFITLGGASISWKPKKQVWISLSSTEAEYRSMRRVSIEIIWLVCLLADLSAPPTLPVTVHSDSQAAIYIDRNPVFHERTKHVELDCHFVRQQYLSGLITLSFLPLKLQLADLFTKPLTRVSHHQILPKLGVFFLPSNLRGDVKMTPHNNLQEEEQKQRRWKRFHLV